MYFVAGFDDGDRIEDEPDRCSSDGTGDEVTSR